MLAMVHCNHRSLYVCIFVLEQLPGLNSALIVIELHHNVFLDRNHWVFEYQGQRSSENRSKFENCSRPKLLWHRVSLYRPKLFSPRHALSTFCWRQGTKLPNPTCITRISQIKLLNIYSSSASLCCPLA